jgi:hypothetical protein
MTPDATAGRVPERAAAERKVQVAAEGSRAWLGWCPRQLVCPPRARMYQRENSVIDGHYG